MELCRSPYPDSLQIDFVDEIAKDDFDHSPSIDSSSGEDASGSILGKSYRRFRVDPPLNIVYDKTILG